MKWSSHDSICWKGGHILDISSVCGMPGCPPLVLWNIRGQKEIPPVGDRRLSPLWGTEGYPPCRGQKVIPPVGDCARLKRRVGTPIERIADIDAWRPEASMPGWPGWLAWLAGWLDWLAWLAGLAWLDGRNAEILTRSTL